MDDWIVIDEWEEEEIADCPDIPWTREADSEPSK